jgi:hypothetical protein
MATPTPSEEERYRYLKLKQQQSLSGQEQQPENSNQEDTSQPIQKPSLDQNISNRPSAIADLIKNPTTMQHPLGAVLRTLGGAQELYQGVPASIGLDLQAGKLQDILPNLMKVISGQRPAQYGDVFRGANVPEPISAGLGLASDVLLSPGGAQGIKSGVEGIGAGLKGLKGVMKWDTALQQAGKAKEGLDTLRNALGSAKSLAVDEVKDIPASLNWGLNKSQRIIEAIKNPVYDVEFTPQGGVLETIGNLDKVKKAVGELISSPKVWEEAPKTEQRLIKMFYGEVRKSMVKASEQAGKSIEPALKAYDEFMDKYTLVDKTLADSHGTLLANKMKSAFKIMAEPAVKQAWKDVSKASPEVKSVMDSMNRRELLSNILKVSGATALGTGAVKVFHPQ